MQLTQTKNSLRKPFSVYLDMLDDCARKKLYWSALHVLIIIPDICGALESNKGEANSSFYKGWCKRYVEDMPHISAEEWYEVRCKLLHQGTLLAKRGRYEGYRFTIPDINGNMAHLNIFGRDLNLDVTVLLEWTKQGLNL